MLGGYSVIEADSIDEAVEVAKTWPGVDRGWITMEVRPALRWADLDGPCPEISVNVVARSARLYRLGKPWGGRRRGSGFRR